MTMTDYVIVCPECNHVNEQPGSTSCDACGTDLHGTLPEAKGAVERDDARRLKHLEVTPEWIVGLFKDGNEIRADVVDGLPEDAEFRRMEYHFDRDVYWVIVWSSGFEALAEGEPIPETVVEFVDVRGTDD